LVLELKHPNLEEHLVEIQGKELAFKNVHFSKKRHQTAESK
jgi:hypothetical protein